MELQGHFVLVEYRVRGGSTMAASSLTHLAEVMAAKNVTFIERWEGEHVGSGSKGAL